MLIISLKNYLSDFFSWFIKKFIDVPEYFINSFKNIKVFFVSINSNKPTTKLLCYWFLHFFFCCHVHFFKFPSRVYSLENKNHPISQHTMLCLHVFFLQVNFFFVNTNCFLVKKTSYCLNTNLILDVCFGC